MLIKSTKNVKYLSTNKYRMKYFNQNLISTNVQKNIISQYRTIFKHLVNKKLPLDDYSCKYILQEIKFQLS